MSSRAAAALLCMTLVTTGCSSLEFPRGGQAEAPTTPATTAPASSSPSPAPSPSPTAAGASEGPALVEDEFSDDFSGWDVVGKGQGIAGEIMGYREGTYFMRSQPPNRGFASLAPIDTGDGEGDIAVEVDLRFSDGRGLAGLLCRANADQTVGYLAGVDTNGRYVILRIAGKRPQPLTRLGAKDPALQAGNLNSLRLECIGTAHETTLRLLVGDKVVAETVDAQPLAGGNKVGLFVLPLTRRGGVEAIFDDFLAETQAAEA